MTEKRKNFNGEEYHPSEEELVEANNSRLEFEQRFEKLLEGKGEPPLETTELALGLATRIIRDMDRTSLKFKDLVMESYLTKSAQARQSGDLEKFYELIEAANTAMHEFQFLYSQHPGCWNIYNRKIIDMLSGVSSLDIAKISKIYTVYIQQLGWYVKDPDSNMRKDYARACGEHALFLAFYSPEKTREVGSFVELSNRYGRNPYGGDYSLLTCTAFAEAMLALQKDDAVEAARKIEVGFDRYQQLGSDRSPLWLCAVLPVFAQRYVDIISTFEHKEQVSSLRLSSLHAVSHGEPEVSDLLLSMISTRLMVVEQVCGIASQEFLIAALAVARMQRSKGDFKSAFRTLRRTRQSRNAQEDVEGVLDRHHIGVTYAMMFRDSGQQRREAAAWKYVESLTAKGKPA